MHAYQYIDPQVFTDNLQEEYLGKKSLGWFTVFLPLFFIRGELRFGFGTGLEKGLVFVVIVSELSAKIFFTR